MNKLERKKERRRERKKEREDERKKGKKDRLMGTDNSVVIAGRKGVGGGRRGERGDEW